MIYASIDLGSDSVKVTVIERIDKQYNVLASTNTRVVGIKKGIIRDETMVVKSLEVALLEIDKDFTKDLGVDDIGDTSDIISYGLQIKGVEVTLLIKEVEDGVKASLRAKSYVDVRKIAEIFGGGGHVRASGIKIKNISMEEAKYEILNEIQKEL